MTQPPDPTREPPATPLPEPSRETATTQPSAPRRAPPTTTTPDPSMTTPAPRRLLRSALSLALLAGFLAWAAWYVTTHAGDFAVLLRVPPGHLAALAVVTCALLACNGFYIRDTLRAFELRLPVSEWLGLSVATTALNWVLPLRGGAGFRALYLRRTHRFPLAWFVSTFSALAVIYVAVHGALGLVAVALLSARGPAPDLVLTAFFAACTAAALAVMLVPVPAPRSERAGLRQLRQVIEGWNLVRGRRHLLARLVANVTVYTALTVLQAWLAFDALGVRLPPDALLLFTAAQGIALVASLTPGAIGIVDATSIYLGQSLRYDTAEALMEQLLVRGVLWAILLLAAPPALRLLGRRMAAARPTPAPEPPP